jgi:hypothetical protein
MVFYVNHFIPFGNRKNPPESENKNQKSRYSCACEKFAQSYPQIVDNSGENIFLAI